jgi:hypothetical protein
MIFFSILVFAALANALATPNSHFPASRHSHVAKRLIDFPSFPNPDVQNYLEAHNTVRLQHDAPALVLFPLTRCQSVTK